MLLGYRKYKMEIQMEIQISCTTMILRLCLKQFLATRNFGWLLCFSPTESPVMVLWNILEVVCHAASSKVLPCFVMCDLCFFMK